MTEAADIVQEIIRAAPLAHRWEPKHPQYVEGSLYLTQEQWNAVCEAFPSYDEEKWACRPQLAWGIPVRIIKAGEPVTLPSGEIPAYSALMGSMYVFDPEAVKP